MHLHRSANAIRVSPAYQRRRAGVVVLPIEVDAVALADVLIEARLIDPNMVDDRRALATATGRLIEIFCKDKTL
jgi:hypothetical protein